MPSSQASPIDVGFAHHQAGNLDVAESLYREALDEDRKSINGLHLLGLVMHQRGRAAEAAALMEEAVAALEQSSSATGDHAALYNNLGNALRAGGRGEDALARYRQGLALDPNFTELHVNLADSLLANGQLNDAVASYRAALALSPGHAGALMSLACILIEHGMPADALPFCRQLVSVAPDDVNAQFLLGRALSALDDNQDAILALIRCLKLDPQHAGALYWLGTTLAKTGKLRPAAAFLERAATLRPDDASAHAELGNVLQELGETAGALDCFRTVGRLRPLTTWPAKGRRADFSALLIASPGIANTPPEFLLSNAPYDCHFFSLLPGAEANYDLLGRHGSVVINLISDPDQGRDILTEAAALVDRLGRRTINHPRRILATDRETAASLLADIESCHVPQTIRVTRAMLTAPDAIAELYRHDLEFPLLLRRAGSHGGENLEKAETADEMAAFLAAQEGDHFYVTHYVDYRSDDGYFRKYRFVLTDRDILPYHLAIGENWKVHHYTTKMDRHPWMQDEEKRFLNDPGAVFSPAHFAAMATLRERIGLDFFGIDCSLERNGRLLVFETNASILIHDDNVDFPYKTPSSLRIKEAFGAMLARAASQPPPR